MLGVLRAWVKGVDGEITISFDRRRFGCKLCHPDAGLHLGIICLQPVGSVRIVRLVILLCALATIRRLWLRYAVLHDYASFMRDLVHT